MDERVIFFLLGCGAMLDLMALVGVAILLFAPSLNVPSPHRPSSRLEASPVLVNPGFYPGLEDRDCVETPTPASDYIM